MIFWCLNQSPKFNGLGTMVCSKVSKSQKIAWNFIAQKNEWNISQNSALESKNGWVKKIKAHYYVK